MPVVKFTVRPDNMSYGYSRPVKDSCLDTLFTGQVVGVDAWTGPEPHWDSGWAPETGVKVTIFNGRTWQVVLPDGLRGDMRYDYAYEATVDASPDAAHAWLDWETWFTDLHVADVQERFDREKHDRPENGKRVRVVKGRKLAIGSEWYVDRTGQGDYGPYLHLSERPNGPGEYARYINPANVAVIDPFTHQRTDWTRCPTQSRDPRILQFGHEWNAIDRSRYDGADRVHKEESALLLVFADLLRDLNDEEQATVLENAGRAPRLAGRL